MTNKQNGFTIIEIVVGLAVGVIVALGMAFVTAQSSRTVQIIGIRSELESMHFVALQQAHNVGFIATSMGIIDSTGARLKPALDRCLMGRLKTGENCSSFNQSTPVEIHTVSSAPVSINSNVFNSRLEARLICSVTSCSKLNLHLKTDVTGEETLTRDTEFVMDALTLAAIEQVDFKCSQTGAILTDVDLTTRTAKCLPILPVGSSCPSSLPMKRFGTNLACQVPVTSSCAQGISSIGLFTGMSTCTSVSL